MIPNFCMIPNFGTEDFLDQGGPLPVMVDVLDPQYLFLYMCHKP